MTSIAERWAAVVTERTRAVIVVLVMATVLVGAGGVLVEERTDISQFESASSAVNASKFVSENFLPEGGENRTTMQLVRQGGEGEDVLTRGELRASLEFQQELRSHPDIGPLLVTDEPATGIGNVLALSHIERVLGRLDGGSIGAEEVAALNASEQAALAGLLGFEAEQETVVELFGVLEAGGNNTEVDIDNLSAASNETVAGLAADLGFDSDAEQETVVELVALLGGAEPPLTVVDLTDPTPEEAAVVSTLLGVEQLPPEGCLDGLAARERAEDPRAQQQPPPLACQIWALEDMDETAFERAVQAVLGPEGQSDALALVPQSYEPGSTTATAHNTFITHRTEGGSLEDPDGFSNNITAAQAEIRQLAESRDREYVAFGLALLEEEINQSLLDSTALVAPVAFLFVVAVLTVVYRDLLDILLGVVGMLAVLLWLFGFMGWTGIPFNQLLISVPVLLIGLSIDFALHAFMRHRENQSSETSIREAMRTGLAGVVVALAWVTATTAIGFLSNLVSPIEPLRNFGLVSAFSITAALLVFGALVPALKIELDESLTARGYDRRKRAFGTDGSQLSQFLKTGAVAARRAPVAVVLAALLLSGVGAYGATQINTSFQEEDFLADDPPDWTQQLPGPMATSEYSVTDDLRYLQGNFQQVGREGELLIRGDVTDDRVLRWLDTAVENASEQETVYLLPNGQPDVRSPLTALRVTAELNPDTAFGERFRAYEGVPAANVTGLYSGMTELNPAASEVVYAENGRYEAIRMQLGIRSGISQETATADLQRVAAHLEAVSNGDLTVVATGDLVVNTEIERNLFQTVTESLVVTLVAVFVFLLVAYRLTGSAASLGFVTLLPVLLSVAWILGTMWLARVPFNALTGTIASLTIGLGIDYSIHISDRYEQELRRQGDVWAAMRTTVTGTGGALLGTAATTAGGFSMLAVAILPALRQFGIVIGLTIVYAFFASVLVLPSLLVLWTRYLGPDGVFPESGRHDDRDGGDPVPAED